MPDVYVLLCEDGSLYTGYAENVEARFKLHLAGKGAKYTRSHKPVQLVFCQKFATRSEAMQREHEIKSWTRQQKITKLKLKTVLQKSLKTNELTTTAPAIVARE